jgi:hypothetical protein
VDLESVSFKSICSSVDSHIEEDCKAFDQLLKGEKADFPYQIDWETFKTRVIAQDYNLRTAFCKTILSLYSYLDPKSFKDGRDIDTKDAFSGYYKHNLHHFSPGDTWKKCLILSASGATAW